jgi:sec-independent protein translocase protein TatB
MFDIGWSEMVMVGAVALIVIGPKELPGVIRTVGKAIGKLKTMAGEFRGQFDEAMREADLHEVKKTFDDAASTASSAMEAATSPLSTLHDEVKASVESIRDEAVPGAESKAAAIDADARALEAEAAEPAPKPRKPRKKPAAKSDAASGEGA